MTIIHSDKYFIYENIYELWMFIKCWKFEKEQSTLLLFLVSSNNELSLMLLLEEF